MRDFPILPPGKAEARSALLAARREHPPAWLPEAASRIAHHLAALVRQAAPTAIAAYLPFGTEPGGDLLSVLAEIAPGARVILPYTRPDRDLDWVPASGGPPLGVDAITSADLIIVPALAVDRHGVRLGRGGGSYDRALARRGPGAITVALLHDGELVEAVPAEPHDQRVDGVVLPSAGAVWFTTAGL